MPINDRREITFNASAIMAVIMCSPRAASAVGLKPIEPIGVQFDPRAGEVRVLYDDSGQSSSIRSESLSALLVSYCLRATIRIPRHFERSLRVESDAVMLVFGTHYPVPPSVLIPEPTKDRRSEASDHSWKRRQNMRD